MIERGEVASGSKALLLGFGAGMLVQRRRARRRR